MQLWKPAAEHLKFDVSLPEYPFRTLLRTARKHAAWILRNGFWAALRPGILLMPVACTFPSFYSLLVPSMCTPRRKKAVTPLGKNPVLKKETVTTSLNTPVLPARLWAHGHLLEYQDWVDSEVFSFIRPRSYWTPFIGSACGLSISLKISHWRLPI